MTRYGQLIKNQPIGTGRDLSNPTPLKSQIKKPNQKAKSKSQIKKPNQKAKSKSQIKKPNQKACPIPI
jgi:hypothetical protein